MHGISSSFGNNHSRKMLLDEYHLFDNEIHTLTSTGTLENVKDLAAGQFASRYKANDSGGVYLNWTPILWDRMKRPIVYKAEGTNYIISVSTKEIWS